jgi:hypothetical protein
LLLFKSCKKLDNLNIELLVILLEIMIK